MTRDPRRKSVIDSAELREARVFAQALLGNSVPHFSTAEPDTRRRRDLLEWLAKISTRHEEELRRELSREAEALHQQELLEWAAKISTRCELRLRRLQTARVEFSNTHERMGNLERQTIHQLSESEWDPADHPRLGRKPNRAWFAPTGGSGAADDEREFARIKLSSGDKWNGETVLDVISSLAPGWLSFLKRHLTLRQTSNGKSEPTRVIRSGEFGPEIKDLSDKARRRVGPFTIHVEIPPGWDDIKVVQHILDQLADDIDVHRLATDYAAGKPELFKELATKRFKNGLPTIAALASSYYSAIASILPGGQVAVATWDIQNGDHLAAALNLALLLPLGKLATAGIERTGAVAIKAGDKVIGILPIKAVEKMGQLSPDQKALLSKRLLAAKSKEEAVEIVQQFLATPFHAHHPLAKFLSGHKDQALTRIPKDLHLELHAELRKELRAAGLTLRIGGPGGSATDWARYLSENSAVRQKKAFDAILQASRTVDKKHGTSITQWVWKNLMDKQYIDLSKLK